MWESKKAFLSRALFLLDKWAEDRGWLCSTLSFTRRWTRNHSLPSLFDFRHILFLYSVLWDVNGVPFVNKKYTKGLTFLSKIVYNSVRNWTSGRRLPHKIVGHPPLPLSPPLPPGWIKDDKSAKPKLNSPSARSRLGYVGVISLMRRI